MPFTTTIIDGGLDLITPAQSVKPGRLLDCLNYEIARVRGLSRMDGYEKFDGGPSPSSTGFGYNLVTFTGPTPFPAGDVVALEVGGATPGTDFNSVVTDTHYFPVIINTSLITSVTVPTATGQSCTFTCGPDITVNFVGSYLLLHNNTNTQMFIGQITNLVDNRNATLTITVTATSILAGAGQTIAPWAAGVTLTTAAGLTTAFGYVTLYMDQAADNPLSLYVGGSVSDGTITGTVVAIQPTTSGPAITTNQQNMDSIAATYALVAATIEQVPGQNSVNGVFWLRDQLYATRDYVAVFFNTGGNAIPHPGDQFYQGASLATATFRGRMLSYVQQSGDWTGGNAGGQMTLYDTFGTLSLAVMHNDTAGVGGVTVIALDLAPADGAGLYLATGQRGATLVTRSWQTCDLGWNIHYSQCGIEGTDFIDQNTALTETKITDQYQTTPWHTASAGTAPAVWTDSSGVGAFPAGMATPGDGFYVYVNLTNVAPTPAPFVANNFGFTDADIPPSATLIGIEIQMTCGAEGLANKYSSNVIDGDFEIVGVSAGTKPKINSISPIAAVSATSICAAGTLAPADVAHYTFAVNRDAGAPSGDVPVPTSLLGYSAISVADLKTANFGVRYAPTLDNTAGTQSLQFGIDQLQVRATYLAQTNLIYFWNGTTYTDGKMTAGSPTLQLVLSHPFLSTMTLSPNLWTVIVAGAGQTFATAFDGTVNIAGSTVVNSPSGIFLPSMVGHQITVFGVGPVMPGTINATYVAATGVLTVTTANVLTANMVNWVVEVPTAQVTNGADKTLRARINTVNVGAGTCTLVTDSGAIPGSTQNVAAPVAINIYQPVLANIRQYLSPTQVAISVPMSHPLPGSSSGAISTIHAPIAIVAPLVTTIQNFGFGSNFSVALNANAITTVGTTIAATGTMVVSTTALSTTTSVFSPDMVGWQVKVTGAGAAGIDLIANIVFYTDAQHVTLSVAAQTGVAGVAVTIYPYVPVTIGLPVLAQVVMHYNTQGDLSLGSASGMAYFAFISPSGVVGGTPRRPVLAGEEIRTVPDINAAFDGGVLDRSIQIASSSSAAAMNAMDPSTRMAGVLQPNGTLAPPSKYQSTTKNFYASSGFDAIYGVSGGGPTFYFDGVKTNNGVQNVPGNFSRILTGLPIQFETPRHIIYHQGHIILAYYAGIAQSSNAANVLSFNPLLWDQSARLLGFGDNITGIASINGDTLAVWTKSMIQMVQGNFNSNSLTTNLYTSTLSPTSGGIEYTIQPMANYMYCDFRGITAIGSTNKYGDFELGHYSAVIQPFIIPRVQTSAFFEGPDIGISNSVLIRNKNMARYVFNDGVNLSMTFLADNEDPQFTIQQYFYADGVTPLVWNVVQAFTESLGRDRIFGAAPDGTGWVYELERGTSFQGGPITGYGIMVPDVAQTPYQNKIYSGFVAFGQAQDYASFTLSRSAEYDEVDQATGGNVISHQFGSTTAAPTGKRKSFKSLGTAPVSIEGTAINFRFDFSSNEQFSHTLQAMSYTIEPAQELQE